MAEIEVVGSPESSDFTAAELGSFAPKTDGSSSSEGGAPQQEAPLTSESPAWMWADGVAGQGDKPSYLLDHKFKSVADQARGYAELEKVAGTFKGAPKDGYDLSKLPED